MADDVTGAVRRTPRPTPHPRPVQSFFPETDDHQTPETGAPVAPGATNPGTPVSPDTENASGELSGRSWTLGDDVDRVVAEFAALPECTACGGSGKDDHATAFEASLAVHFAGPPIEIAGRRRQLCMWCGHVLRDLALADGPVPPWADTWPVGKFVHLEDGVGTVLDRAPHAELPPGCCALPEDEDQAPAEQPATPAPAPWGACPNTPPCEHPSLIHDVSGDPEDPKPMCCADGCRCGQPDPGPDEAQETRAAADWPAEPVDTHADEQEADRG